MCSGCKWAKHVVWLAMFIHPVGKKYWSIFVYVFEWIARSSSFALVCILTNTLSELPKCFLSTIMSNAQCICPEHSVFMYLICIRMLKIEMHQFSVFVRPFVCHILTYACMHLLCASVNWPNPNDYIFDRLKTLVKMFKCALSIEHGAWCMVIQFSRKFCEKFPISFKLFQSMNIII